MAQRTRWFRRFGIGVQRADPQDTGRPLDAQGGGALEAALRIRVSDRAASRDQLARLLELSGADDITLRVIPFDLDGFSRASNSMTYLGGPLPKLDTVVRDAPYGSIFIDSEAQLNAYRTRFRKVEAVSLEPERSRDFIHGLAKEL